jgi:N-methylhydantoinase A
LGRRIEGPAIINQMDTTTLIPAGWRGRTVASGALIVERSVAKGE